MSAKATDQVLRVGCGRYDWHFNNDGKVVKLVITIEVMNVLPGTELHGVMHWLFFASLPVVQSRSSSQVISCEQGFVRDRGLPEAGDAMSCAIRD
jgi:hypothetical protein